LCIFAASTFLAYVRLPGFTATQVLAGCSILQAGDMFTVTKQFLHSPFGKIFYVEVEVRARQVGCRVWVMQHPDKVDTYVLELERKSRPQQDKTPPTATAGKPRQYTRTRISFPNVSPV
jgi:hypothetical protein